MGTHVFEKHYHDDRPKGGRFDIVGGRLRPVPPVATSIFQLSPTLHAYDRIGLGGLAAARSFSTTRMSIQMPRMVLPSCGLAGWTSDTRSKRMPAFACMLQGYAHSYDLLLTCLTRLDVSLPQWQGTPHDFYLNF